MCVSLCVCYVHSWYVPALLMQITTVGSHSASLVMVRGSVPILWSQPGYKYKPPPVVDKGECDVCVLWCEYVCSVWYSVSVHVCAFTGHIASQNNISICMCV